MSLRYLAFWTGLQRRTKRRIAAPHAPRRGVAAMCCFNTLFTIFLTQYVALQQRKLCKKWLRNNLFSAILVPMAATFDPLR
ncbi:MAG: hypothetical protein PHX82_05470, partial [Paracoccaceae bacterium]|nr:hypothetical protein [Paracoccaceae bacterium]